MFGRIATLFAPDWSRLPLGTAVNTAVQSVAPRQLHFARTLWGSARLQTERGFCFRPVRGPWTDVCLQRDRVRGRLQAAVQKLVVRVAAQAPPVGSRFCQGFSFMRQKRAFLPDMQFQWSYTINPDFARDMFFSEFVPAAVSAVSGANNDKSAAIIPAISAAAGTPTVTVQEILPLPGSSARLTPRRGAQCGISILILLLVLKLCDVMYDV